MPGVAARPPTDLTGAKSFARKLSEATGLSYMSALAWTIAEGAYAPNGTGGYNYLNVQARQPRRAGEAARGYSGVTYDGRSPKGFAQFATIDDAVKETAFWINRMPNYTGIRRAIAKKQGPATELSAIRESKWDAGHYAGGRLQRAYAEARRVDNGGAVTGAVGDAVGAVTGAAGDAKDAVLGGLTKWVRDLLGGLGKLVIVGLILGLAAALFYNGVRRLSGDRMPSPADLARIAGAARGAGAAA